jgi:two-component system, response regulator / RNA-binding antiterminator
LQQPWHLTFADRRTLRVLLLHETTHDVQRLAEALAQNGDVVRSISANALTMASEIEAWPAEVLLIAADDPSRDMIEQICVASAGRERAIVMFTEADDPDAMRSLVQAGVSAYVVAGCTPSRLRPVINVALERFAHEQAQFQAIRVAKQREEDDRAIAKAKAYLQRKGMSEPEAHATLRKTAMRERRTIAEVAQRLVGASRA